MLRRSFLGLVALLPFVKKVKADIEPIGIAGDPVGGSFTLSRNCPVCGRTLTKYSSYIHGCTIIMPDEDGVVRETRARDWCNCADAPHKPFNSGFLVDHGYGDGVTDDTEAMRQAIESGKDITFPGGTYWIR